jgi:peptidoglycan LD-endopeptidase LytH
MNVTLTDMLIRNKELFFPIIKIDKEKDTFLPFDFTKNNTEITSALIANTADFSTWVNKKLADASAKFGIGGYNENRVLYQRSNLFEGEHARSLHLGVDVWGAIDTPVFAPLGGIVHSFAYNDNFGDYGATIILQHHIDMTTFYTLYGHLSLKDLYPLRIGKYITRGELIGHFGEPKENGDWPPHLHFQIIDDIGLSVGDYPGVCSLKEAAKYLQNSPDANLMLNFI